jgi:PEP-CTERM motif
MKKTIILAAATTFGLVYLNSSASAQIYDDNFAADSSLSSSYLNLNSFSTGSDAWTFNADSALQLQTTANGQIDDVAGSFSAVTLSTVGQYVTFTANFNSSGLANGIGQGNANGAAGLVLFALDNSHGVSLGGGGSPEAESSSASGGQTAGYTGFLGQLSLSTSPKTSTKFYAKTGTGNNDISYYSDATPDSQITPTEANTLSASGSDNYTLTYQVEYLSATEDAITTTLFDNTLDTQAETWTVDSGSTTTPTETLDTFDFGIYTGSVSDGYDVNLTQAEITTGIEATPEPSTLALASLGLALPLLARFRRR